jgi:hypothetical protein
MKNNLLLLLFFSISFFEVKSQNTRLTDTNTIGWYNYFGTFKLDDKFSIHSEYQWRRNNIITENQQGLLRVGANYQVNNKIQLRVGYAWVETYPYGDYPINSLGRDFTEHRIFQAITLTDKISKFDVSHRFMLEQRFVGRYTQPALKTEDDYPFLNRLRYMFRIQMPLKGAEIKNKIPYLAAYNEVFIGFGKNINENIFDQNRIGLLIGYRFDSTLRIEAGYLNQTLQLGREIDQRNVFQNNHGFIVNTNFNFDLSKKKQSN